MKFTIFFLLSFTLFSFQKDTEPEDYGNWEKYSANIAGMYGGIINFRQLMHLTHQGGKIEPPKAIKGCNIIINDCPHLRN